MKFRILGTIFVLVILAAAVFLMEGDNQSAQTSTAQPADPNTGALQGLKIN